MTPCNEESPHPLPDAPDSLHAPTTAGIAGRRGAEPHTRKDNDLVSKLRLPPVTAAALRRQCAMDAELLQSMNVMDYSLLLGVHHPYLPSECATPAGCGRVSGGSFTASFTAAAADSPCRDRPLDAAREESDAPFGAPPLSPRVRSVYSRPRAGSDASAGAYESPRKAFPRTPATAGGGIAGVFSPSAASTASDHGGHRNGASSPLVFASDATGDVYYIGIIDLFQTWTWSKRIERFLKICLMCRWGGAADGMSVVEPRMYCARFLRMIERIVEPEPRAHTHMNMNMGAYQPPVALPMATGLEGPSPCSPRHAGKTGRAANGAANPMAHDEPWRAVEPRPRIMSV